jgi:hypothetical protein
VAKLKEAYPTAKVELWWCEDEHRLGLKPIIRRVWSPIGQRGRWSRSTSVTSGPTFTPSRDRKPERFVGSSYPPRQRTSVLVGAGEFRRGSGSGQEQTYPALVVDGAGWHTAKKKKLKVPEGIHLEFLPSHSPELQPSERLWTLSDEKQ